TGAERRRRGRPGRQALPDPRPAGRAEGPDPRRRGGDFPGRRHHPRGARTGAPGRAGGAARHAQHPQRGGGGGRRPRARHDPARPPLPDPPRAGGAGAVGPGRGTTVSDEAHARVHALFSRAGVAVDITEDQVHAFIAAAGSMPALEYALIESMIDESVRQGLARDLAATLVQQTVRGAATVLQETGVHAAIARNSATSPAGTTAEALAEFDRHGVRAGIAASMAAAEERSRAMSGD